MNRRAFLKGVVAASTAALVPLHGLKVLPTLRDVTWVVDNFDYDCSIGVGCEVIVNGVKKRHAVMIPATGHEQQDLAILKDLLTERIRELGWIA